LSGRSRSSSTAGEIANKASTKITKARPAPPGLASRTRLNTYSRNSTEKICAMRPPGGGQGSFDGRPVAVSNFLSYSLVRLGVEYIDIYRPARLDPNVPIEDTVGAIADLVTCRIKWLTVFELSGLLRR